MCRQKSRVGSSLWVGLGLLVFIVLPLTVMGWRHGKLGCKGWGKRRQNAQAEESQQQKLRRMDQTLREAAGSLERLSTELRKETGSC